MSSTIFFYTNNFLHRRLLEATLLKAIHHARNNGALLLVTSHYPLFKSYIDVSAEFGGVKEDNLPPEYKDKCIKDLNFDNDSCVVNYVTGKLPYQPRSILKQLIFSCDHTYNDNVVLFEHDCFYPEDYIKVVEKSLLKHGITYCMENYYMINKKGFYLCEPHPYLSSFAGRREFFGNIMKRKDGFYKDRVAMLEPLVPCDLIIKDINWTDGKRHPISKIIRVKTNKDTESVYTRSADRAAKIGEALIEDSFCIDNALGSQCILEFQHGLNTTASLFLMRHVYDESDMEEEYKNCHLNHPYWGNAKYFTDLIDFDDVKDPRICRNGVQDANL